MGAVASKSPHAFPKEELSLACSICSKPALEFESFVSVGPVHELVSQKVSEMMAFLAENKETVRCQACTLKEREQLAHQTRLLEKQNARAQELLRRESLKLEKNQRQREQGSLRRRRSFIDRIRSRDSLLDDEDYLTAPEDEPE